MLTRAEYETDSINDMLAKTGHGQRKHERYPDGKRIVFRLCDGEVIGRMDACACADWIGANYVA